MSKPQITFARVEKVLSDFKIDLKAEQFCLLGIRGYFRDSMGRKGKNDIGIFDDGMIWVDSAGRLGSFNGNTDPSRYYKRVATLKSGAWRYKKGLHGISKPNPYPAFRQAEEVTVLRYVDGTSWVADTGWFGINIHRGGSKTTSSAGCQTIPPVQWDAFREFGYSLLKTYKKSDFLYLLVENDGSIA